MAEGRGRDEGMELYGHDDVEEVLKELAQPLIQDALAPVNLVFEPVLTAQSSQSLRTVINATGKGFENISDAFGKLREKNVTLCADTLNSTVPVPDVNIVADDATVADGIKRAVDAARLFVTSRVNTFKASLGDAPKAGEIQRLLWEATRALSRAKAALALCDSGAQMTAELVLRMLQSITDDTIAVNSAGHTYSQNDGVIWRVGELVLRANRVAEFTPKDAWPADGTFERDLHARDPIALLKSFSDRKILHEMVTRALNFAILRREVPYRLENDRYSMAICLAVVLTIARMPQYVVIDIRELINCSWLRLSVKSAEFWGQVYSDHDVLYSDAISDATRAGLLADWSKIKVISGEDFDITADNYRDVAERLEWVLRLKLGPKSLHTVPVHVFVLASVLVNAKLVDHPFESLCDMLFHFGQYVLSVAIMGSDDGALNTLAQRVNTKIKGEDVGVPVTFEQPYSDMTIVNAFVSYVKHVNERMKVKDDERELHTPFFAIIQSSGTGKTRLVMEAMSKMPVFFICLRPLNSGTPRRSPVAADYLTPSGGSSVDFYQKFFLRLLVRHFADSRAGTPTFQAIGKTLFNTGGVPRGQEAARGALTCEVYWHDVCFGDMTDRIKGIRDVLLREHKTGRRSLMVEKGYKSILNILGLEIPSAAGAQSRKDNRLPTIEDAVLFLRLAFDAAFPNHAENVLPVLVAIDEAAQLLPAKLQGSDVLAKYQIARHLSSTSGNDLDARTVAESAARTLEAAQSTHFFKFRGATEVFGGLLVATVLDTNSSLWNFAPLSIEDGSFRVVEPKRKLADPYYRLAYPDNLNLPSDLVSFTDCVRGRADYPKLAYNRFELILTSRPLFHGTLSIKPRSDRNVVWSHVSKFATLKLLGAYSNSTPFSDQHCMALFGVRFPIAPRSMFTANRMISGHMATVRDVTGDRTFATVCYPSDALLAEASVRFMNRGSFFSRALGNLTTLVCLGLVSSLGERGAFGEFAASMLLARAFDWGHDSRDVITDDVLGLLKMYSSEADGQALQAMAGQLPEASDTEMGDANESTNVVFFALHDNTARSIDSNPEICVMKQSHAGAPITLLALLKSLLASAAIDMLDAASAHSNGIEMCLQGWVRILQFIPNHCTTVSFDMLRLAWRRIFAIQTHHSHKGCDMIIPVLMPDKAGNVQMSGVFVEVKNHADPPAPKYRQEVFAKLLMAARSVLPKGPIVLIAMYIGCEVKNDTPVFVYSSTEKGISAAQAGAQTATRLVDDLAEDDGSGQSTAQAAAANELRGMSPLTGIFPGIEGYPQLYEWLVGQTGNVSVPGTVRKRGRDDKINLPRNSHWDALYLDLLGIEAADVLAIECFGCDRKTFGGFMTDADFKNVSRVSQTATMNTVDLTNTDARFGLPRKGVQEIISRAAIGENLYFRDLGSKLLHRTDVHCRVLKIEPSIDSPAQGDDA